MRIRNATLKAVFENPLGRGFLECFVLIARIRNLSGRRCTIDR